MIAVARKATSSETRAPMTTRLKTLRPSPSVPNQFSEDGPDAEPNSSRYFVDCSFGGRCPVMLMIWFAKIATKISRAMKLSATSATLS
jgi:hypothetical protein